ncbi:MAG TPA: peptidase E [Actinomycetota bacterium]|jgi:peptidase E
MTERRIVAMGGGGFSDDDPVLDRYVFDLVDASRPRVCFVPTASGDIPPYLVRFYEAFPARSFETSVLRLFQREVEDLDAFLGEHDVIYVGGGNTANLLDVWRRHGVDRALASAWEAGVVLCGVSAGANCWFEASTTDSFLVGRADPLLDGLGLLPGAFSPHFDSELARRPRFHELVGTGELPDGLACDDFAAVRFDGTTLVEAVASRPGAGAYRVARSASGATEERLPIRALG